MSARERRRARAATMTLLRLGAAAATMTLRRLGAAAIIVAPLRGLDAQPAADRRPVTLPNTEIRTLHSAANGVHYELYVSLPPGYGAGNVRYPVIYLLDADYSFAIARNITEHLTERNHLPPVVLVAIAYGGPPAYRANRTRDYTPTRVPDGGYGPEYQRLSGGAPAFLRFIRDELIPFIEREYRVSGDRAIVGHSYGGLFVTWAMMQEPTLFRRVIAVSPSLWYDDHLLLRMEQELATRVRSLPMRVYAGVGIREVNAQRNMITDLQRFTEQLREHRYDGLDLQMHVLDEETHNSVFPIALTKGLRWVYRDLGAR